MIRSMTGFGRGEFSDEISKVTVEIRSVNHRYLDIYVKMPRRYSFAEETIKSAIKERIHRGKVEVSVSVDNIGKSELDISSLQMFTTGLKVKLNKTHLQPGEQATLKITADTKALRAARSKPRVLMITNDPMKPKVVINIEQ
jgi:uncharacterized protein (TIGR00255 family)